MIKMCMNYKIAHNEVHNAEHNKSTVGMQYNSKEMLFFYLKLFDFFQTKNQEIIKILKDF